MAAVLIPTIEETEIDGVPVLWSAGRGLITAALQFRVGRADERPTEGGITHIVEHLAMVPLGQPRYDHNAFVEPIRTLFFATGTPRDVTEYFRTVGSTLRFLPTDRLEMEREILTREGEGRSPSVIDAHRHLRFGLSGHGLPAQPEFGLASVSAAQVTAWAETGFGSRNAAAWLTGPPPTDLRFPLSEGQRLAPPMPESTTDIHWPAHVTSEAPGVGVGFLLRRQPGAGTFVSILHRRLRQRLRLDHGLVYDVLADYEPLDASWAIGTVGADCSLPQTQHVVDLVLGEIDALARAEATEQELADEVLDIERDMSDETATGGLLDIMVRDRLLGMPARSAAERYDEQRATTAADVATRAIEARTSALLMADAKDHPVDFTPYPTSSVRAIDGRDVKPLLSVLGFGPKERLVIGPDGVTMRATGGTLATVRYADCIVLEWPVEDELVMWGRDGTRLYVPGAFWRGGEEILAEIGRAVPGERVIRHKVSMDYFD